MIKTARLHFVACKRIHLEAFARGKEELTTLLQVTVPENWPTFPEAFSLPDEETSDNDHSGDDWASYFFLHSQDRVLVGNGGFVGGPDASGCVEIGYEIAPEYWNQGFATEAVRGLLDHAFAHEDVQAVRAHTLGAPNASNAVLKKVGMTFVKELDDPEVGKIWQWQISRGEHADSKSAVN